MAFGRNGEASNDDQYQGMLRRQVMMVSIGVDTPVCFLDLAQSPLLVCKLYLYKYGTMYSKETVMHGSHVVSTHANQSSLHICHCNGFVYMTY